MKVTTDLDLQGEELELDLCEELGDAETIATEDALDLDLSLDFSLPSRKQSWEVIAECFNAYQRICMESGVVIEPPDVQAATGFDWRASIRCMNFLCSIGFLEECEGNSCICP